MSLTASAFLLIFFGGLLLSVLRHPMYGLGIYVLVFYFNPPSRWWGDALPEWRWALIAGAVTLVATLRLPAGTNRPTWIRQTPAVCLIAYAIWVWIQQFWALDQIEHLYFATLLTKLIIVFYLIYRIVDTPEKVADFLLIHVIGCLYLGWLAHTADYSGRLDGVGGPGIDDANTLGMQMATGIAAGSMLILQQTGWKRWLCVLAMPFMLDTVIMTGSRSAFLALVMVGTALWLIRPYHNRRIFRVLAVAGVMLFFAVASVQFWERMATLKAAVGQQSEEEIEKSALSRKIIVQAQVRMAKEHPLGAGHRGTAVMSPDYLEERWLAPGETPSRSSHNTFMTAWVEQGIPGIIIFLALWLWVAKATWQTARMRQRASPALQTQLAAVAASLAAVFVAGMFVDYVRAEVQFWMFPLLAVLQQAARETPTVPEATNTSVRLAAVPKSAARRLRFR